MSLPGGCLAIQTVISCCVTPNPGRDSPSNESKRQPLECVSAWKQGKKENGKHYWSLSRFFIWFSVSANDVVGLTLNLILTVNHRYKIPPVNFTHGYRSWFFSQLAEEGEEDLERLFSMGLSGNKRLIAKNVIKTIGDIYIDIN